MRIPCTPFSAAALLAAAASAHAQNCLWTPRGSSPQANGQMVYDSELQRVLFVATGGYSPVLTNIQVWSWNGAAWALLNGAGPSARFGSGLAYDSARDRVVLFGGTTSAGGSTFLAETWEWDGATWAQAPVSGPTGRTGLGMTYDQARQQTVLFGGYSTGPGSFTYLGDTWVWDGHTWTQVASAGPAPRSVPCFAYDSVRARTVMSSRAGYGTTIELWEWDGATWLQRSSVPPPTLGDWMVFDPGRARMIAGNYGSRQTWELDTAAALWSLRDPGTGPVGPAAFDVALSRAIVLNGTFAPATFEYNGAATVVPPSVIQQPYGVQSTCNPAVFTVHAGGTALTYQWRKDGQPLIDGGNISGVATDTLTINPVSSTDAGSYEVLLSNSCATLASSPAQLTVDTTCYANCDHSTTPPILNVNDFSCFLNKFAAGDPYADCTGGCNPPPCLNVLDFACFLNKFAAGCCTAP